MVLLSTLKNLFKIAGITLPASITAASLLKAGGNVFLIEGAGLFVMWALEITGGNEAIRQGANGTIDVVDVILKDAHAYERFEMLSDFTINSIPKLSDGQRADYKNAINNFIHLDKHKMSKGDLRILELATIQATAYGKATGNPSVGLGAFAFFCVALTIQKHKLLDKGQELTIANLVKGLPGNVIPSDLVKFFEGTNELNYDETDIFGNDDKPNFNDLPDKENIEKFKVGISLEEDPLLNDSISFKDSNFDWFEDFVNSKFEPVFDDDYHFDGFLEPQPF